MRFRHFYSVVIVLAYMKGCGKDDTDFENLDGEVGSVPGSFLVRLSESYRGKVDSLESQVDSLVPGLAASITTRFSGDTDLGNGAKLSDLLKVDLPGTESDLVNKRLFNQLSGLTGADGRWFDVVDTKKFLGTTTYDPPIEGDPNRDTNYGNQYYLEMIRWEEAVKADGFDARLINAAPVVVAVLDTGVEATHEDLAAVMWTNSSGEVGYDATTMTALGPATSTDENGHGTHVAGIIGAIGGNGKGIHGVGYVPGRGGDADQSITEIMAIKVLNKNGSGTSDMIGDGIKWAVEQHWTQKDSESSRNEQRLILNMSLGGPFETDGYDVDTDAAGKPVFKDDMITYATSKNDVLVVVAAGNETCKISGACDLYGETIKRTYYYPCSYANVLCVAASTHEDKLAGFSNRLASVGMTAPGWQMISTLPATLSDTGYGYFSGTSQATPVAAGAAAILWSLYPAFTAEQIKQILQKTAASVAEITSEITSTIGRLDLKAALAYASQLTDANQTPEQGEPNSGVVSSEKISPSTTPAGGGDPSAPSENASASGPSDKGSGSAKGCAAIGVSPAHSVSVLPLLLASPVIKLLCFWIFFGRTRDDAVITDEC